jgi:hypothetical protein
MIRCSERDPTLGVEVLLGAAAEQANLLVGGRRRWRRCDGPMALGSMHGEAAGFHAAAGNAEGRDARRVPRAPDLLLVPGHAGCGGGVAAVVQVGTEV